jgi:RNA polymerase sigma-70 factor (ECF subfamily)
MDENECLAERFEANRSHLNRGAYRMLGSRADADDAVQKAWLRLSRTGSDRVENLGGWLTTVVARVCLDMLRSRRLRREEPIDPKAPEPIAAQLDGGDMEHEAVMADSVGLALLVVLETLAPAERVAFVLHDVFDLPFDDIAPIVGRSATATRQLASRARRRVRGAPSVPNADISRQRRLVEAYLEASRSGDLEALLAVLDPNVVLRADPAAAPAGAPTEVRGAPAVARQALAARGAGSARAILVNGAVGVAVAPRGRLRVVLRLTIDRDRISEIELIAAAARLHGLELGVLDP